MTGGPLWAYSCFPIESANNHLKKLSHGSRDMSEQVSHSYIVLF